MPDRRPIPPGAEPASTDPNLQIFGDEGPFDPLASTAPHSPADPATRPHTNSDVSPPTGALTPPPRPRESFGPPVRTSVHPGVLLDRRYQLQQHISDRAHIQLWQGEDQVLARAVAIRLVIDDGSHSASEDTNRLLDAARRSGQLLHTGAASTYDATTTTTDGLSLAYVVSEWVNGISLLTLLNDGPLLPNRAAAIVRSVAQVIAAAHAVGVAHGDLHPGDVIVTSHGLVKVLDLEMRSALGHSSATERRERDLVGLGALLYASLTGRWPLGAGRDLPPAELDPSGACRSPRQLRAGVPRELDSLAMAALSVGDGPAGEDPHYLPDGPEPLTAAGFAAALTRILAELPTGSSPVFDDNPEADMPAVRTAKAAQAQRMAHDSAARRRSLRRRLLPIVLLVVLALAAWVIGVAVGRLPDDSGKVPKAGGTSTAKPLGKALALVAVHDFDPQGDGTEDPTGVPYATDGDTHLNTFWSTEFYQLAPWGGNPTKTGVGLKVDLGRTVSLSQVRMLFTQPGVSVELRYNDSDSASLESYTVGASSGGPSPTPLITLAPRAGSHRYWLVWLTGLPKVTTSQGVGYLAQLSEMKFFG
jgi:serine/threonine protein kinase